MDERQKALSQRNPVPEFLKEPKFMKLSEYRELWNLPAQEALIVLEAWEEYLNRNNITYTDPKILEMQPTFVVASYTTPLGKQEIQGISIWGLVEDKRSNCKSCGG